MELVYLEWEDASAVDSELGWIHKDGIANADPQVFRQVGFVFDCDLWAIVVTEAYGHDQVAPRTRIPLGMIRRLVRLDPAGWPQEEET